MGEVPREVFLPPERERQAYNDQALPLTQGQTISQPFMVAIMTEALALEPSHRVLEIGTGSGYQTAVLAELAGQVYSLERIQALASRAEMTLRELAYPNIHIQVGDGSLGWPEEAPFDSILVTAGAPHVPESLKAQLREDGGRLVIPVGDRWVQDLVRVVRRGNEFGSENLLACRFVPLLGEEGWDTPEAP
jgi:protein-L-isoaspartate(D-aspartate) O-methyltransferase